VYDEFGVWQPRRWSMRHLRPVDSKRMSRQPFFKGEVQESPRKEFLYWSDDGDLFALRYDRWKSLH
jgi:hypothetical protein